MLSTDEAKKFYDRFGAKQDSQAFYEDAATNHMVDHAAFDEARSVLEFGCGTGRFAEKLLRHHLHLDATYRGMDLSETMVNLARERLADFSERSEVTQSGGGVDLPAGDQSVDRVISNFVLDLLPDQEIQRFIGEAYRVLKPGALLCLVSLTKGKGPITGTVTGIWSLIHRISPSIVGGCRPINLLNYVRQPEWDVFHNTTLTSYCLPSEILVAERKEDAVGRGKVAV